MNTIEEDPKSEKELVRQVQKSAKVLFPFPIFDRNV